MALEAIRGELTVSQPVARHGVHRTLIDAWKKQAIDGMAGVFSGKAEAAQASHAGGCRTPWLSNTMDVEFCIEAAEEAMARHGRPDIFNTDRGSQFTSPRFAGLLTAAGIRVSMDGPGLWMDNVFIERLW